MEQGKFTDIKFSGGQVIPLEIDFDEKFTEFVITANEVTEDLYKVLRWHWDRAHEIGRLDGLWDAEQAVKNYQHDYESTLAAIRELRKLINNLQQESV